MIQTFERDGAQFHYPQNWAVDAGDDDAAAGGGWTVTVQSPGTAFFLLSLQPDAESPADLADRTLDALRSEYKELDAENAVETVAGEAAVGHNIDFLTLDTAVTCWTRCLSAPAGPLLVMCQTSEYDRDQSEPVLRAIVASLRIEAD